MRRWLAQMPKQMLLKSESCASSLYDPAGYYSLAQYCADERLPYPDYGKPVSRELFAQYALSFQQKLVPDVQDVMVTTVIKLHEGFELHLSTGETLHAGKVIAGCFREPQRFSGSRDGAGATFVAEGAGPARHHARACSRFVV